MRIESRHSDVEDPDALAVLLEGYSVEVTPRDAEVLARARPHLPPGAEVFIAALPKEKAERQVETAVAVRALGYVPVPHIVARRMTDKAEVDALLSRLSREAGVDRALVLGGDRDRPAGTFESALQVIETGLFERHGFRRLFVSAYPEGHPRIPDAALEQARADKLAEAANRGLSVELVSQFGFDAAPILAFAERLQRQGCTARLRVGVAGPADPATLIKYALMCGVGPSLRTLKERRNLTGTMLAGETPDALLSQIAETLRSRPDLPISGVHLFTFSSLANSVDWAAKRLTHYRAG